MTETEWLTSTDPMPMLAFLRGKASDRKLRLFAVECCRRVWHLLTDERSHKVVEVAERFAEGLSTKGQLGISYVNAVLTGSTVRNHPIAWTANNYADAAAGETCNPDSYEAADSVCWAVQLANDPDSETFFGNAKVGTEHRVQATLLRDVFGNPFRPVALDPSWLTVAVNSIAQVIYGERRFEDLPILADALEDVGCTSQDLLGHCRSSGPHVRGCWVVDLILGKQ